MTAEDPKRPPNPFVREGHVDKPGIIGSHWWNKELAEASALRSRRNVILALAVSAGVVAVLGAAVVTAADSGMREELRRSLDVQRDFGWSFGATSETVAFELVFTPVYSQGALSRMVADLTPRNRALEPWFIPTLFQSPSALPRTPIVDPEGQIPVPLSSALRPIHTPSMIQAEKAGAALAKLLAQAGNNVALVIDLDGPEAVSFAAGVANRFEPVFLFDNWPHPRGVVPAHLTLAATLYHQPSLAMAANLRPIPSGPAFVLDRKRLSAYTDEAEQFDNRWLARLPGADDLVKMEVKRVLYVSPTQDAPIDSADLSDSLEAWAKRGIDVRAIALDAFSADTVGDLRYGGSAGLEGAFFSDYPWGPPGGPSAVIPKNEQAVAWRPHPAISSPAGTKVGFILVDVNKVTGLVVSPHTLRSGSYNRASGGSWGGG